MIIRQAETADARWIAKVHVDYWQDTYRNILPDKILNNLSYNDREERWKKSISEATNGGSMMYVSEDNRGITGFALGGTMRDPRLRMKYTGELYMLCIDPKIEDEGIEHMLLGQVAAYLNTLHHSAMAIWAFENHPLARFYERAGADLIYDKKTHVAGTELKELAFGWDNLDKVAFGNNVN